MSRLVDQWHNRQGAECPPDLWPGNFCWPTGEKREKGKGWKMEKKRRKIVKGKVERRSKKMRRWEERISFFFFFFSFHFSKPPKFVLGLPKWKIFYQEKAFHAREKIRKNYFTPSGKFFLLRPCFRQVHSWGCNIFTQISKRDLLFTSNVTVKNWQHLGFKIQKVYF